MLNHTILIKVFLSFVIFFRFKIIPRQSDNPKPFNINLRFETCKSENLTLSTFKFGFQNYVSGNNTATNNKIKVNSISMWSVSIMGGRPQVIGMLINNLHVRYIIYTSMVHVIILVTNMLKPFR